MAPNDPLLSYPLKVACNATTWADHERQRAARCQAIYERAALLRSHDDPDVAELAKLAALLAAEVGGLAAASSALPSCMTT